MEATQVDVGLMGGPGSLELPIILGLGAVQAALTRAQHPLASVPQWTGRTPYLVEVKYIVEAGDHEHDDGFFVVVMIINTKTPDRAEEIARLHHRKPWLSVTDIRVTPLIFKPAQAMQLTTGPHRLE